MPEKKEPMDPKNVRRALTIAHRILAAEGQRILGESDRHLLAVTAMGEGANGYLDARQREAVLAVLRADSTQALLSGSAIASVAEFIDQHMSEIAHAVELFAALQELVVYLGDPEESEVDCVKKAAELVRQIKG